MNRIIGVSDGIFSPLYEKPHDSYADKNVERILSQSPTGVEVVTLGLKWWPELKSALEKYSNSASVQWLSLHITPSTLESFPDLSIFALEMRQLVQDYGVKNIVFHADLLHEVTDRLFFNLLPISVENTDMGFGHTAQDVMETIGDKYYHNFGITLDIQHLYGTGGLIQGLPEFHQIPGKGIVEYHVSNWEYGTHGMLRNNTLESSLILGVVSDDNIPVIIESMCGSTHDYAKEIEYVRDYCASNPD